LGQRDRRGEGERRRRGEEEKGRKGDGEKGRRGDEETRDKRPETSFLSVLSVFSMVKNLYRQSHLRRVESFPCRID
jgi:hypothetical protein